MTPKRSRFTAELSKEKPKWGAKALSEIEEEWQPILYKDKLAKLKNIEDVFVAERKTTLDDFRNFGVVEGFERLGWLATLTFNNNDKSEVYMEEIIEWMSTLKKETGDNPPWTTKLIGTVNNKKVSMSMKSLLKVAPFDTLPQDEYGTYPDDFISLDGKKKGPEWVEMLGELFAVPFEDFSENMILHTSDLKPLPRLITKIFTWNVIPRLSDKGKLRHRDVKTLYALVTGRVMFPFRQLVMMNVWEAHEKSNRSILPHCRLLSCLLKNANALSRNSKPITIFNIPFCRSQLGKGEFAYKETVTHFILHDVSNKRTHEIAKDVVIGDDEEDVHELEREYEHLGKYEPNTPYPGKPPAYRSWNSYERESWDRDTMKYEEFSLWMKEQKEAIHLMMYQQEKYYQYEFEYSEQVRLHEDYRMGLPYVENVERVDYKTLPKWDANDKKLIPVLVAKT